MLVYVSGPYSDNNKEAVDKNIENAAKIAAELWENGHAVFCPHLNSAHLDELGQATYEQYINGDLHILCYCDAMVLTPDWERSKGARIEKDYADKLGIPIYVYPQYPLLHVTEIRCPEQSRTFREIIGKMYRVHLKKNADYSPVNIMGPGELGIVTRIWDKVTRLMNLSGFYLHMDVPGEFISPETPQNESIDDTFMDLSVYGIIGQILRQGKWGH